MFKEDHFTVEIQDQRVFFRFRAHYTSEDEARSAIRSYLQNWEFLVGLERGPDAFHLRFLRSEIIDRNPPKGVQPVRISIATGIPKVTAIGTVRPLRYPKPAATSTIQRTPEIDSMYHRYLGYRTVQEPLPSMAYFCLTMLKRVAQKKGTGASKEFGISSKVIKTVSRLSSTAGGEMARKQVASTSAIRQMMRHS